MSQVPSVAPSPAAPAARRSHPPGGGLPLREDAVPPRTDMTPMIDVVFQLIVFFLCSMRFRSLDMKIEAVLPRDRGIVCCPIRAPLAPTVRIDLRRNDLRGERHTRVVHGGRTLGELRPTARAATISAVEDLARRMRASAGDAADDVRGEVDAGRLVPTGDVIRIVDALRAAGIRDVTFIGAPDPGTVVEDLLEPGRR